MSFAMTFSSPCVKLETIELKPLPVCTCLMCSCQACGTRLRIYLTMARLCTSPFLALVLPFSIGPRQEWGCHTYVFWRNRSWPWRGQKPNVWCVCTFRNQRQSETEWLFNFYNYFVSFESTLGGAEGWREEVQEMLSIESDLTPSKTDLSPSPSSLASADFYCQFVFCLFLFRDHT